MKNFYDILLMDQEELKTYMIRYLKSNGDYKVSSADGYVIAIPKKNEVPVILTAHLDTIHKERVKEVVKEEAEKGETIISSPQGIGGDDRCGVWIIMNLIKRNHRPYIILCEDEERGCVGSGKFVRDCKNDKELKTLFKDVHYMIEVDRRGSHDAVFYSCDNKDFTDFIEKETGYKTAIGSCSDISNLMPELKIAGVNFSCGYYKEHTVQEYINISEMENTIDMIDNLLAVESKKYEYIEKKYTRYYGDYFDDYGWYGNGYYGGYASSKSYGSSKKKAFSDTKITLIVYTDDGEYETDGDTKPEAWMNFFMANSDICFNDVADYEYM